LQETSLFHLCKKVTASINLNKIVNFSKTLHDDYMYLITDISQQVQDKY